MFLTVAKLPPKEGHVEVEIDGVRQYKKVFIETEDRLTALETEKTALTAKLNASIQSNQFLEDCLVEMAEIVYA